jgi:hypothetical protein
VASESDHRGLLGIDRVQAGPLRLRVRYRLSAPGGAGRPPARPGRLGGAALPGRRHHSPPAAGDGRGRPQWCLIEATARSWSSMKERACLARSPLSSHRLRQIASMFDSTGDTTVEEKLSKVIVPV